MFQEKLLTLSDVQIVDAARVNPHAAEAERIIEDLCRQLGIWLPHIQEYNTMSAYLFPRTTTERLVAIGLFNNLLYFIDDVYDRNKHNPEADDEIHMRHVFENCFKIIFYGLTPDDDHRLYPVCFELHRQFKKLGSDTWLRRFTFNLLQHLKATTYSLGDIMKDNSDGVAEYIRLRELDSGMHPTINFIEFAYDICLPDEVLNHPFIRRIGLHCARYAGLLNDIFSYEKEVLALGSEFNLLSVMMTYYELSFEEAVHESVMLLNQCVEDFLHDEQRIPRWEDERVNQMVQLYVQGLHDQMIASWHWQISTNRYRSPNSPFAELRTVLTQP